MRRNSGENPITDVLTLIGLVLIGAAVYLAFGLPATLAYAGVVVIAFAVVLALVVQERRQQP